MKRSIPYYLFVFVLLGLMASCSEDDEAPAPIVEPVVQDNMYFPPVGSNEWREANVDSLGWDKDLLQEVINYVESKNSYSFIILRKGKIVAEKYWQGMTPDSTHVIESAGKSMTAFLIGILQDEYGLDINEKVSTYLGAGWSQAPAEKEAQITVKELMTMTSGLDYEKKYIAEHGSLWYYSNDAYEVLLNLFKPLTGKDYIEFSNERLFSKIGMSSAFWKNHMIHCNARDMARFGLMILAKGKWKDEQLMADTVFFKDMLNTSQTLQPPYGYLWWLNGKEFYEEEGTVYPGPLFESMPSDAVIAAGRHEQRIEVVPSLDIVVVRQGLGTLTPERGPESFGNGVWQRLMKALSKE